jgi:hypothetical protein
MSLVTGTLTDFGLQPLAGLQPQIVFKASAPATKNGRLLATRPTVVVPQSSGYFTVDLISTDGTTPQIWYEVSIRWLDLNGGYISVDFLQWKLNVPIDGGTIGELLDAPANSGQVWFGPEPPDVPSTYTGWVKTDVNPPTYYEWV